MKLLLSILACLIAMHVQATEWHFNTCGIATFRTRPEQNCISSLATAGMIDDVIYQGVGRYGVHISCPLNTAELYQPIVTTHAGCNAHVDSQDESQFNISTTDNNGNYVDCDGQITVSFNRLSEGIE